MPKIDLHKRYCPRFCVEEERLVVRITELPASGSPKRLGESIWRKHISEASLGGGHIQLPKNLAQHPSRMPWGGRSPLNPYKTLPLYSSRPVPESTVQRRFLPQKLSCETEM